MILAFCRWKVTKSKHLFKSAIIYLIPNHYLWLDFSYHRCLSYRFNWYSSSLTFRWDLLLMPSLPGIRPWRGISIASPSFFLFDSDHLFSCHRGFLFSPLSLITRPRSLMMLLLVSFCAHISLFVMSFSFFRGITAIRRWPAMVVLVLFVSFFTLTAIRSSMMFSHVILLFIIVIHL